MKPKEVISKINTDYGGVPIKKKGGVIDAKAEIKRLRDIREKKQYVSGGEIKTGYSVVDKILDQAQPLIEELVEKHKEYWIEKNKPLSYLDIEYLRLELVSNLVKALSNYIDKNDTVKDDIHFKKSKGVVSIICTIIRDGKEMNLEVIPGVANH
jgi:hypothetical protein